MLHKGQEDLTPRGSWTKSCGPIPRRSLRPTIADASALRAALWLRRPAWQSGHEPKQAHAASRLQISGAVKHFVANPPKSTTKPVGRPRSRADRVRRGFVSTSREALWCAPGTAARHVRTAHPLSVSMAVDAGVERGRRGLAGRRLPWPTTSLH